MRLTFGDLTPKTNQRSLVLVNVSYAARITLETENVIPIFMALCSAGKKGLETHNATHSYIITHTYPLPFHLYPEVHHLNIYQKCKVNGSNCFRLRKELNLGLLF